jgi:2-polyprenyl-3-methyl-5-hydroxy-6-metoxy-1,4-benzoquinol methylase
VSNITSSVLDPCIVCKGAQFSTPARCPGFFRCDACGLVLRQPEERARLDAAFYEEQHVTSIDGDWVEGRRLVFADEIQRLAAFRKTGRILDVGAGHGFFLSACQQHGWQSTGIEIGRQAAAYAREHFDLEMLETPIEEAALPDGAFDVVSFWNVLDQLPDPPTALRFAVRALRPGGLLIVRCPNTSFHLPTRQLARHLGVLLPFTRRLDALTVFHLFSFPPSALRRLLENAGLHSVEITAAPLSWTEGAEDQVSCTKRLFRRSIFGGAVLLKVVSGGRLQLCPSIMARALKPIGQSSA